MVNQKPPYSAFSTVYDKTMTDIPYHQWAYYIYQVFDAHGLCRQDRVLDVGAGTGMIAEKLSGYYEMVALDISYGMLSYARQNAGLHCVLGDMVWLPFAVGEFSAAYSTHDCLNYLTTEETFLRHLGEVFRVLKPGGLYIFDYSTQYNVMRNFNNKVFREIHGNRHMRWANTFDPVTKIVRSVIDITEFLPGWFGYLVFWKKKKYREIHIQKVFDEVTIERLCRQAGFEVTSKDYDYKKNAAPDYAHILVYVLQKSL